MIVEWYKYKGRRLYCAFVDYKKAFELVDRAALWSKVLAAGIRGRIIQAVIALYDRAKSRISLNGKISEPFASNIGVRQGENLSPLLFAVFLNDFSGFMSTKFDGLDCQSHQGVLAQHILFGYSFQQS